MSASLHAATEIGKFPNQVYNFLGGLFDNDADSDPAAALAAMGPNTRETAWLCLRNLHANMQVET